MTPSARATSVEGLLEEIRFVSEERHALVQAVRTRVQRTLGSVDEEVKYGGILFASDGVPVGGVFAYARHVSVEFGQGAAIADPFGFLEGGGQGRRHVKLRSEADIDAKHLAEYLALALEASRLAA